MILLGLLFLLGIGNALVQSFGYIPAFDMMDFTLRYYEEILQKPVFIDSIRVSFVIALVSSVLAIVLGVLLCAVLVYTGNVRGKVLQIIKLPILIPHTIVALFIITILSQNGLLARIMYALGLLDTQGDFPTLLFSTNNVGIIIAYLWKEIPFVAYFVLALMASINTTLGEAAENLGASRLKTFFYITLPLCMPAIKKAFLIIFAFSFGAYEIPFLLGPTLPKALPVQAYVEYMHPDLRHRPYAMAMNSIMLLITLAMAVFYYWMVRKNIFQTGGDKDDI
ncbi:ABC transporter permease subunit [Serpentinicella alkaliphila]|nr:ABC transporter permease subunit [Serpentinicella alkaliphila]QUH27172.1 ABC transporter permease subunit [Serpentinicella alkaliphila]